MIENDTITPWSDDVERLELRWRQWGHRYFRKAITDTLKRLYEEGKILDVGCGAGILYRQLPKLLRRAYIGVDFTPEFIELCKERYPKARWEVGNILDLPFLDDFFPIVNTTNVLQHVEDWEQGASELIRVSNKYVINTIRIDSGPTRTVPMKPRDVLHRYFNPKDVIDFYKEHGKVSWKGVRDSRGKPILGLFITRLR